VSKHWPLLTLAALLCVIAALYGCSRPPMAAGAPVDIGAGAKTGDVDTGAEAHSKGTKVEGGKAGKVDVQTTYGDLTDNWSRMLIIAMVGAASIVCFLAAAPSPPDARVTMGLYVASGACLIAAVLLIRSFWG